MIKVYSRIVALEPKSRVVRTISTGKTGADGKPEYHAETENLGWFVTFEGSHESLYVGATQPGPEWVVGRRVEIIMNPV